MTYSKAIQPETLKAVASAPDTIKLNETNAVNFFHVSRCFVIFCRKKKFSHSILETFSFVSHMH